MMTYDAKSMDDVRALARRLAMVRRQDYQFIAANILGHGLMRPQWWVRWMTAIGSWRHRMPKNLFLAHVIAKHPAIADELIPATCAWIAGGKDADGEGVGGFNQREVNMLARWLDDTQEDAA
jgi:hypothetical protein